MQGWKKYYRQELDSRKKQADPILADDENLLWEKYLLGGATSKLLLNIVFSYNCKLFGLDGKDEHRSLTRDQFSFGTRRFGYLHWFSKQNIYAAYDLHNDIYCSSLTFIDVSG